MLNNISWQGYWTALAFTTAIYYGCILLLFYRKQLVQVLQQPRTFVRGARFRKEQDASAAVSPLEQTVILEAAAAPEAEPLVRALVDELQFFFESLAPGSQTKAGLLTSVKGILQKYPSVQGTPYQNAVSNLIPFLAEQYSSIHLGAAEVGSLWPVVN